MVLKTTYPKWDDPPSTLLKLNSNFASEKRQESHFPTIIISGAFAVSSRECIIGITLLSRTIIKITFQITVIFPTIYRIRIFFRAVAGDFA